MTNFGSARIRQDSLTDLQLRRILQDEVETSSLTLIDPPAVSDNYTGKQKVSKEQSRKILKEALKKRSEPFPQDITTALERFQLEAKTSKDGDQFVGAATSVISVESTANSTTSETEEHIAEHSRQKKKRRQTLKPPQPDSIQDVSAPRLSRPRYELKIAPMRPTSLLIASLGNPPPYHSTRHSAAHIILKHLQSNLNLPSFTLKSRPYGGGHVSIGADVGRPELTLWQSPSLMNVSGPPLLKAWKNYLSVQSASPNDPVTGLIVLHDEMETESGRVKVKRGNTSARGHNGIKSVQASLQGAGLMEALGDRYVKVGIGIGRPTSGSRDTRDVSAYVLGQLTPREKEGLANATGELVNVIYQEMARIGQNAG